MKYSTVTDLLWLFPPLLSGKPCVSITACQCSFRVSVCVLGGWGVGAYGCFVDIIVCVCVCVCCVVCVVMCVHLFMCDMFDGARRRACVCE